MNVRPFSPDYERAIVDLWNKCLPRDEISLTTFRRKIVLDPNFDAGGCLVAHAGSGVVGFVLSIRRRYPYYDLGLESGKGWITAFFVHPEWRRKGVGTKLFQAAEEFLRQQSVRSVFVSDYTPNYFIPGVDIDAYESGYEFLKAIGFHKVQSVYGMGRSLVDFSVPRDFQETSERLGRSGFSVVLFNPQYTTRVLEFLRAHYPGDLFRVALERMTENPECDEILIALKGDDVVGFSHFLDERFGPFAIHPEFLGRGLGPLLYYHTVEQMRKKGKKNLWLAWTTGRAKDFYHRVGLKVLRRHVIMEKKLSAS